MPNTASAKKANRQNTTRRKQNVKRSEAYKAAIKSYKKLVEGKKMDEAKTQLSKVYKALDKTVKTNVITKNKASRLKSRLTQLMARSSKASS